MKNRIGRVLLAVLAFVLLTIGHLACGGDSYNSSPTAPSSPGAPTPTPNY